MDLLIDTHIFIWWNQGGKNLPTLVFDALSDPANRVYVSAASVWEIATKQRNGKLRFEKSIAASVTLNGFTHLPISSQDAEVAGGLAWEHRDPFDRMLVAQCMTAKITLVTADNILQQRAEILQMWAG